MTLDQTDSQTMTELSAKLAQVPLKQKRLLSDDTHAYQHFELPTSPVSFRNLSFSSDCL